MEVHDQQRQERELHDYRDEHGGEGEAQEALHAPAFEARGPRRLKEPVAVGRLFHLASPLPLAPVERLAERPEPARARGRVRRRARGTPFAHGLQV